MGYYGKKWRNALWDHQTTSSLLRHFVSFGILPLFRNCFLAMSRIFLMFPHASMLANQNMMQSSTRFVKRSTIVGSAVGCKGHFFGPRARTVPGNASNNLGPYGALFALLMAPGIHLEMRIFARAWLLCTFSFYVQ